MRPLPVLVVLAGLALVTSGPQAQSPSRVVAVGDVHGALDAFVGILKAAQLVGPNGGWTGGNATFVQTGDYTDRGKDVRGVLDLLMGLEPQADKARGRVIVLLGNHEVMNLVGEQRDATPDIYLTFADAKSEERRERAYAQYVELAAARAKARPVVPEVYAKTREAWMAAHPPGWLEYREAFAPRGRYGNWLRKRKVAARVGSTLFMHAGPNPAGADIAIDDIETRVAGEIARVDKFLASLVSAKLALPFFSLTEMLEVAAAEIRHVNTIVAAAKEKGEDPDLRGVDVALVREGAEMLQIGEWLVLAPNGPLWYRGYANGPDEGLRDALTAMLARNKVDRIVVAHSPLQARRIQSRLDGRIFLIDTGMLASVYKGRASALEIVGTEIVGVYEDGRMPITPSGTAPPLPVGALER